MLQFFLRIWNSGGGLQDIGQFTFTKLYKSRTFRNVVAKTEENVAKAIKYAADPEAGAKAFSKSESETLEYLANQARSSRAAQSKAANQNQNFDHAQQPPKVSASGYGGESELVRWWKTKRYEWGVFKNNWFGRK